VGDVPTSNASISLRVLPGLISFLSKPVRLDESCRKLAVKGFGLQANVQKARSFSIRSPSHPDEDLRQRYQRIEVPFASLGFGANSRDLRWLHR
jgi:hypothetical protein